MLFVLPEYREIGLGRWLFRRLLSSPEIVDHNKGLTSVPNMAEKYAKVFGFDEFTEWKLNAITAKIEAPGQARGS
ncbi:hypothetical protein AAVH_42454 [Aphelenchoides avenae]|nr:hypothetical protein AAVH_42454 [Aphelenchus avenae]